LLNAKAALFSPVRVVSLHHNPRKPAAVKALPSVRLWFKNHGVTVVPLAKADRADAVVVLGGDGTLLGAAREVGALGVPVLGINVGRLGFLTAAGVSETSDLLTRLLKGTLSSVSRLMLEAQIPGKGPRLVVNDCVVQGIVPGRVVRLTVSVNGDVLGNYVGDGLIVATPTGSTAYSMAAGGPLVVPGMDLILLTPICPHSLSQRPVLVPHTSVVDVRLSPESQDDRMTVTLDGQEHLSVRRGQSLRVCSAKRRLSILAKGSQSFFSLLNEKFPNSMGISEKC